ncbi:sensor histidine kinase [Streptomyces sp. 35G-GA-8]|uniref:sensor histidine kinase n=1 Tax=Streptomyces sp. 35G-GA-8 TaxID=2939434 RepID=UPI00201F9B57|nr:histidine kinase [Streptomyces sp. 35G-GA-8]MCL7380672.1 histidine kinase [Streptomyces sp. 35G-GA-8]
MNTTRRDAAKVARQARQALAVCLAAPPLAFLVIVELPSPHPVLVLVSLLYVIHLGALLRSVWTGRPAGVSPLVLVAPTLVWLACLWVLPLAGLFEKAHIAPLAGVAVVPAAVAVADLALRVRLRTGIACVAVAAVFTLPDPAPAALAAAVVFGTVIIAIHSTLWPVSVMARLEAAAEVTALLAVAEERLRMSRDLHDTLGRNLAIIALKSELATRTGRVEELAEVEALARKAQSEIRAVVNAARTPSLNDELDGARSLLHASGVQCTVTDNNRGLTLPDDVREVLGWAVREAATNVMRHAPRATACTFTLTPSHAGEVTLHVVNDGVHSISERSAKQGTGLVGLEQRITPLGGRLEHGLLTRGVYQLLITLPLLGKE